MSIKRLIALALCAVLAALCCMQIAKTPALYQYVIPAPQLPEQQTGESETDGLLRSLEQLSENWTGILSDYAMTSHTSHVRMEGAGGKAVTARLTGQYGSPNALPYQLLSAGRRFYDHELENGADVIILDEQLALSLFRVSDPLGRSVTIGGNSFTVVGILRHTRGAGDQEAFGAYVPLKALDALQAETLTVWAKGMEDAGALSQFKNDMRIWQDGGSLYDLHQEKARALLPAWLAACVCLMLLVISAFRGFGRLTLHLYRDYLERLSHRFAVQMIPYLIGSVLLSLLALASALSVFYGWTQLLLTMVYIFPEWIPAVPVEISDILTTWWQNAEVTGGVIEWRTRELITLRLLSALLRFPSLAFTLLFVHTHGKMQKRIKTA